MRLKSDSLRSLTPVEVRTIKKASEAAYRLAGGVSVVATQTRASISQLSKYASTDQRYDETAVPLDVAIEVDRAAGSPVILSAYAEILGFSLAPLQPGTEEASGKIDERDAHGLVRQVMDLAEEIFRALEDGKIDALEQRAIVDKCHQIKRAARGVIRRIGGAA